MRLEEYDYELPESAIAQTPLTDRAASKLLWLHKDSGMAEDRSFGDVVEILRPGDLLVLNETRVTALRLYGVRPSGGRVELLLLHPMSSGVYEALAKPGRRLQPGASIEFDGGLTAVVVENLTEGRKLIRFDPMPALAERLEQLGRVPLPPYIHVPLADPERYQTVYSRRQSQSPGISPPLPSPPPRHESSWQGERKAVGGSAAAPTAGLHFTTELLQRLQAMEVRIATVNLQVGLDTFRPITAEDPRRHAIHGETCSLPAETQQAVECATGRIVAVGTTAVRTLESFAVGPRRVEAGIKDTRLFITPGYKFKIIDGMFTNFHMPRTTMLLMVSALAGKDAVMPAYRRALDANYRFLSFGDSMLIL